MAADVGLVARIQITRRLQTGSPGNRGKRKWDSAIFECVCGGKLIPFHFQILEVHSAVLAVSYVEKR